MDNIHKKILKYAKKYMRKYIEHRMKIGDEIDINYLVDSVKNQIDYRGVMDELSSDEVNSVGDFIRFQALLNEMRPDLTKAAGELVLANRKAQTVRDIRITSSKALVSSILNEAGYSVYRMYEQKYRIKVLIPLKNNILTLPLKFSSFPEIADRIIPAIKTVEMLTSEFGRDIKII